MPPFILLSFILSHNF